MRIAILGTGLIGGSVGLAVRQRAPGWEIAGYDPDPSTRSEALDTGAVDLASATPEEAVAGADLIVAAAPVDAMPALLERSSIGAADGTVVTDVGSAKVDIVKAGEAAFSERFVGGHPMAGSERHGIGAADPDLFEDAWWILTPTPATSSHSYALVTELIGRLGAKPVALSPEVHDALVARLSHVPQLASSALVDVAATAGDREALLDLAGPGFRDVTRIAASDPSLWVAVLRSNRQAVKEGLERLRARLGSIAEMLAEDRWEELEEFLGRARAARLRLFAKPAYSGEPIGLSLLVPDRPGVLAEVTTAAGKLGANIEDVRIVHSTEGGRGRLELVVAGRKEAGALVAALESLGYRVDVGPPE
jgi:prephenate dehydrogenase